VTSEDEKTASCTETGSWAVLLCLCGIFLHIVLSDPLLNAMGFHYSGEQGRFYEKMHPGTYFILLSFLILAGNNFNPIETVLLLCLRQPACMALLFIDTLALAYMALRSDASGLAFMIDTHISAVICAIVLARMPEPLCQKMVTCLIIAALANGIIGIAEALGKFRIFLFDPDWTVLHEEYFRASAFIGHPLDNAMFTAIVLFITLASDYPQIIKACTGTILMAALLAFGGRAALFYSIFGLISLTAASLWRMLVHQRVTLPQLAMVIAAGLAAPLFLTVLLWLSAHGGVGERLTASMAKWDNSADARRLAFTVFHYMTEEEIWFGISPSRIVDIVYRMNLKVPLSDLENPWIMMCISLGMLTFPFWLLAMFAFIYHLMKHKPLALQLAIMAYFLIASTANSFGRKDANFLIMVSAITCAGQLRIKRL